MLQLVVETTEGEMIHSSIPLTEEKYKRLAAALSSSPQVRAVYATPVDDDVDALLEDIDQFILDITK